MIPKQGPKTESAKQLTDAQKQLITFEAQLAAKQTEAKEKPAKGHLRHTINYIEIMILIVIIILFIGLFPIFWIFIWPLLCGPLLGKLCPLYGVSF